MSSMLIGFSGQGMQHPAMFERLKSDPLGKIWLEEASQVVHLNLFDETIIEKYQYDVIYAQLFTALLGVGTFRWLRAQMPQEQFKNVLLCGYSLGEATAFCVSAELSIEKIHDLIQQRATLMKEVSTQYPACGMAAIMGAPLHTFESELEAHSCYLAIVNAPDHYIIGGEITHLEQCILFAKRQGAKTAKLLPIKVPSHTPLLLEATQEFEQYLRLCAYQSFQYPILNALTSEKITNASMMLPILANELSDTLHWDRVMKIAREYGNNAFLELGPRSALKTIAQDYFLKNYALEDFQTLAGMGRFLLNIMTE